jgi:ATP-binding cassette subfamily F protein 3
MIQLVGLTKRFGHKVLFENLDYQFPSGERLALVGANGAGKTTLLNCICGIEDADGGQVVVPQQVKIGYLPQEPNPEPEVSVLEECLAGARDLYQMRRDIQELTQKLASESNPDLLARYEEVEAKFKVNDGYRLESKAHGILDGLGFSAKQREQDPRELSGGWRMRLELAKLFLDRIDFLVLDEPTNHLDLPTLVWVENFLTQFPGTLLFVSHDRALLNRLPTRTLHLNQGQLKAYPYTFDKFLEARDQEREQDIARLENLEKKREHLEKFVERFGAKATKARQAQSRVKMINKLRHLEGDIQIEQDAADVSIKLPTPPKSGQVALELNNLAIGYSDPLFTNLNLSVSRGNKIAIIGANGIGKSTLLKTVTQRLQPLAGDIAPGLNVIPAYYSQNPEESLDLSQNILSQVLSVSDDIGEPAARAILGAFLFHGDDVFKQIGVLSGGEKSRVALARLLVQKANLLLLDEPTNHLDMASVEALAEAIRTYEGTAMFVSHDRQFIDEVCTHVFVMLANGRCMLFEGKLADYERMASLQDFPSLLAFEQESPSNTTAPASGSTKSTNQESHEQAKQLKSRRQALQKRLSKHEQQQESLTKTIAQIEKEMSEAAAEGYQKAMELQALLTEKQQSLAEAEELWLTESAELEEIETQLQDMGRLG